MMQPGQAVCHMKSCRRWGMWHTLCLQLLVFPTSSSQFIWLRLNFYFTRVCVSRSPLGPGQHCSLLFRLEQHGQVYVRATSTPGPTHLTATASIPLHSSTRVKTLALLMCAPESRFHTAVHRADLCVVACTWQGACSPSKSI